VLGLARPEYSRDQGSSEEEFGSTVLPPPPEVHASGNGSTLLWRAPSATRPRTELARHPLLCIAAGSSASPGLPRSRVPWPPRFLVTLLRARAGSPASVATRGTGEPAAESRVQRGHPVVVVVAGGSGGTGRTTLAVEVATALAAAVPGGARRVLLVDADAVHPDLDLKLGIADLDSDRCPNARIDRLLLQLPELADKRVHLDSLLWVDPQSGVRALLAPERAVEIGREQLDYLYTYIVAPAFDAIVVDAGPAVDIPTGPLAGSAAFWLALADAILVPLRPTLSNARSAMEGIRLFDRTGVPMERCRLVMGVDRAEASTAAIWQRRLSEFVVVRWPWAGDLARQASLAHRPLSACDRRFAQSIASLLPDLAAVRRSGR